MSASTSGQRQTQNSQTSVDAQTNARMGQIYDAGNAAGNAGPGPLLTGASDFNTGLMTAGATGAAALGGDAAAHEPVSATGHRREQRGIPEDASANCESDE